MPTKLHHDRRGQASRGPRMPARDRAAPSQQRPARRAEPGQGWRLGSGPAQQCVSPAACCWWKYSHESCSWCPGSPESTGPSGAGPAPALRAQHMPAGASAAQSPREGLVCISELQHSYSSVSLRYMKRHGLQWTLQMLFHFWAWHFWQQKEEAFYHPGDNGQVKNQVSGVA